MPDTARALLTALHRAAVEGAAPFARTSRAVRVWLRDHNAHSRAPIRIIATGKAASAMAAGAIHTLQSAAREPLHCVIICANKPTHSELGALASFPPNVDVHIGDHPVPGPASLEAGDAIERAVHNVQRGDVAMVLLSGGTTSLAAAPVAALSQAVGDVERAQTRIANLADTLLESGLAIHEMNAIRRRVLRWGAGRLAVALEARGVIAIPVFAISDVIGDDPAVIGSGPCSADPLDDATFLALLDAHNVRSSLERDMSAFLGLSGSGAPPAVPAQSHAAFDLVQYTIVAQNADAVAALAKEARRAGITRVLVETSALQGEAAQLGHELARRAVAEATDLPGRESALFVLGGEPVVHLRDTYQQAFDASDADDEDAVAQPSGDEPMAGGRMQVLALSASLALEEAAARGEYDARRVTLLAAGTDGRDGPTDAAGAIVDALVPALARRAGRQPERDLLTGRSWFPLDAAGALLRTGPTGTNVMDVVAVLIAPRS